VRLFTGRDDWAISLMPPPPDREGRSDSSVALSADSRYDKAMPTHQLPE